MGWSKKYKRSIDCSNPKGFSQKAHCAGRKKKENVMSSKLEELVGKRLTEEQFDEAAGKKDACYHKVKARYDVWPSAYASGALVKCRKVGAKNWGNKSKKESVNENTEKAVKDMIKKRVIKKGQNNKDRVRAIGKWLDDHAPKFSAKYGPVWIRRIKMGRGGQVQDWWGDTMTIIKRMLNEEKKRDYKAEYKKFQSSPKMKKYRAELNKYNRQKGTYGNGDGKDASHKGGKIVGFESQSKNRGRAEKSRLKK